MLNEIWRHTHVFTEHYCVSSLGRVYSNRTKKVLRPATDRDGYNYYVLCVKGERRTVKAHRLVAMAFIENPDGKPAIDHKNGLRTDNRADNLVWATNKENSNNPVTKPRLVSAAKARLPVMYARAKEKTNFNRKAVCVTRTDGTTIIYGSLKDAAEATGKNYSKLSEILNGRRKQDKRFTAVWASEIEEFPIAVTKRRFPE